MRGRWLKALGWFLAAFVVLGLVLPFVSADRFREPLRAALQNALGRQVTLGEMHWTLFTGPGLRADNVVIGEDPSIGYEPVAYAGSIVATPSLSSLWHGRLECSSLRLEDTHVNVARTGPAATAQWNFSKVAQPRLLAAFPTIRLRGARINFRLNEVKSVFYLLDTDVDIEPVARDGSDWHLRVKGMPARSDRPARGFGSFDADGRWRVARDGTGRLNLNAKLDNSEIGEMLQLLRGNDYGLQGHVSGKVAVSGAPSQLGMQGAFRLEDVHGWAEAPPSGEAWQFQLNGTLDALAQELNLHARAAGAEPVLEAKVRISRYLSQPAWGVQTTLKKMPLDPLVDVARHLGAPVPAGTRLSGVADGVFGYSQSEGFSGSVRVSDVRAVAPKATPVVMASAQILASRDSIHLEPAPLVAGSDTATLEADYQVPVQQLQVRLRSDGMSVEPVQREAAAFGTPLFAQLQSGRWRGELRYVASPQSAGWNGTIALTDAQVAFEGLSEPVVVNSADIELNSPGLSARNLRGRAAGIPVEGDYAYTPAQTRPHQFHLTLGPADASAIERAWMPVLNSKSNLIDRALGRSSTPAWLANWHAEGTVQAQMVSLAGVEMRRLRTHVVWDENRIRLGDLKARVENGELTGEAEVNVKGPAPAYSGSFKLAKAQWKDGQVNATVKMTTAGTGADTWKNLNAAGTFDGHGVDLTPLDDVNQLSFRYQATSGKLALTDVQMAGDEATYTGTGHMEPGGELLLQLSDGTRQKNVAAKLTGGVALRAMP